MTRLVRRPIQRRGMASGSNATVIVTIVAVVGIVGCLGVGLLVALLLPAIDTARDAARAVQSQAVMREMHQVRLERSQELRESDESAWPTFSPAYLRDEAGFTAEQLTSPFGPAPDGGDDYWLHPEMNIEAIEESAGTVAAYDRAMYAAEDRVAVQMFDGTSKVLSIDEFDELASEPPNAALELNLPVRAETEGDAGGDAG